MYIVGVMDGRDHAGHEGLVSSCWATNRYQPIPTHFLPLPVLFFLTLMSINVADLYYKRLGLLSGLVGNAKDILS